jgi:hypothetical protein
MRRAIWGGIFFVIIAFFWSARHYYKQSITWQEKAREENASVRQYEVVLKSLRSQQRKLAELDEHCTEKLNEAEQENTARRTQLARGPW